MSIRLKSTLFTVICIVTALIINMRVVAEGAETEEQLHILQKIGVHAVQGYYFSQPQFVDDWNPVTLLNRKRLALTK